MAKDLSENSSEIGLLHCECGEASCGNLLVYFRQPNMMPNEDDPEELVPYVKLPHSSIPGLVKALMEHYTFHL